MADFSSGFGTRAIAILQVLDSHLTVINFDEGLLQAFLRHANILLQIPAPALGLLIIDKFGRRPILMVSMGNFSTL